MEFSSSQQGNETSQKLPVTRRTWTQIEERCLIEAFLDIIPQGWKADNGFKHGFLIQLLNKLRISLPGTNLTTVNINSNYGSWKKTFTDVYDTLKKSDFNWNSATHRVTVGSDGAWDAWCLANHNLAYVRTKSFSFYYQWEVIFGTDTTNGVQGLDGQGPPTSQAPPTGLDDLDDAVNHNAHADGVNVDARSPDVSTPPGPNSPRDATPSPINSRKRKKTDPTKALCDVIIRMCGKATDSIDKVALRMGREMDEAKNRKMLVEIISNLQMVITRTQKLKASFALCRDEKALDIFHVLNVEKKMDVVNIVLDGMAL